MKSVVCPVSFDEYIDLDVSSLIYQHRGFIFGGCLRDILRKRKPNDIDVFIPDNMMCIYDDIEALGYELVNENEATQAIKGDQIFDIHEGELVGMYDFDVNMLCTHDGIHLYNRADPTQDPQLIINNIYENVALPLGRYIDNKSKLTKLGLAVPEKRVRKIIDRGFYIPISDLSIRSTYDPKNLTEQLGFQSKLITQLHDRLGDNYTVEDLQREIWNL